MNGGSQSPDKSYGKLMSCLLQERSGYATEEEFKAFAVEAVRRFITDLRHFNIEIAIRPHTGPLPPSPTDKLGQ